MDVEKLAQYDDGKGLTFSEAIRQANEKNGRILSNKEISARLVVSEQWKNEKEVYPCWTGTLAVYEAKGTPFGSIVEWEGLKVKVPKKWQGKRDMVILCNHPDFKLADGMITLGKSAKIQIMPQDDGWYDADSEFDFPIGEKKSYESSRRYLWRREKFIGLVSRGVIFNDYRRGVDCVVRPSARCGVLCVSKGKRPVIAVETDRFLSWLDKAKRPTKKQIRTNYLKFKE